MSWVPVKMTLMAARHTFLDFRTRKWVLLQLLMTPLLFACSAVLLFRGEDSSQQLVFLLVGAGVMGMWTTTLSGAADSIEFERRQGLLEYLLTTAASMHWVILGKSLANAWIGLVTYLLLIPTLWLFGVPVFQMKVTVGLLFLVLLISMSFVAMGQLLSFLFVFTRNANPVHNALSRTVYVLSGVMFPLTLLPTPLQLLSYGIPSSYGMQAVYSYYQTGWTDETWEKVFWMVSLTLGYLLTARVLYGYFEYRARVKGQIGGL